MFPSKKLPVFLALLCMLIGLSGINIAMAQSGVPNDLPDHLRDSQIVFLGYGEADTDIHLINLDGSNHRIYEIPGNQFWAKWAPTGEQIVFASWEEGSDAELFIMDADGTNIFQLTDNDVMDFFPTWSPDGQWIVYSTGEPYDLYKISADGQAVAPVVIDEQYDIRNPVWSPDGQQLAYVKDDLNNPGQRDIYILDLENQIEVNITNGELFLPFDLSWSPDGTRMMFRASGYQEYDSARSVYIMDLVSNAITPLDIPIGPWPSLSPPSHPSSAVGSPVWSPTGDAIAFHGDGHLDDGIYIYLTGQDEVYRLTGNGLAPQWRPMPDIQQPADVSE